MPIFGTDDTFGLADGEKSLKRERVNANNWKGAETFLARITRMDMVASEIGIPIF